MNLSLESKSTDQTELIGQKIGEALKGGEVIELASELGGGKTAFTHGLARGIGSKDQVASPTFTISRVYNGEKLTMHHFDFYRLNDAGLIAHELNDVLNNKKNVAVIEWAALVANVLPEARLKIEFIYLSENSRNLLFTYPKSLSYLMKDYVNTNYKN
jgi:tRNA threonylcarbamoyladenosine biosynthesis protein TsaE